MNLLLRFLLELVALVACAMWGYHMGGDGSRILWAILVPLLFMGIWGTFAVRGDPSRSGKTVVPTPGAVRLVLELALFGASVWFFVDLGYRVTGLVFGGIVLIHYLLSLDRIQWLLGKRE